jgi:hypothetical protein
MVAALHPCPAADGFTTITVTCLFFATVCMVNGSWFAAAHERVAHNAGDMVRASAERRLYAARSAGDIAERVARWTAIPLPHIWAVTPHYAFVYGVFVHCVLAGRINRYVRFKPHHAAATRVATTAFVVQRLPLRWTRGCTLPAPL